MITRQQKRAQRTRRIPVAYPASGGSDASIVGCFGAWFVFVALLSFALLGFGVWVIVALLQHFGVV